MTDGNATDALAADLPWDELPPVYPVVVGDDRDLVDVSVERVSATDTNFESAPVTIRADIRASGLSGQPIEVFLYDEQGKLVESQAAALDPAFFRSIYAFARERYDTDKATYHVSAELDRAPKAEDVKEIALPDLLEHFHAREILHVTFGSVLKELGADGKPRFKDTFFGLLRGNPGAYAANLERHFVKHLKPFVGGR